MRGWILDLYPGNPGEMVVWLKLENGEVRRLLDRWSPSIFVASDDGSELARLGGHRLITDSADLLLNLSPANSKVAAMLLKHPSNSSLQGEEKLLRPVLHQRYRTYG